MDYLQERKRLYKLKFDPEFKEDSFHYIQLDNVVDRIWKLLTKSEKEDFKKWREFETRIRNNDFPELSK